MEDSAHEHYLKLLSSGNYSMQVITGKALATGDAFQEITG
jgi:hypothetical protein